MRGVHVLVLFFFAAVTAAAQMQVNPLQINWTAVTGSGAPALYCPTTITGTTTNGSKSVVLTSFTGVLVNQTVTGTGVASGSTVSAVSVPNETVTLSLAATASGTTALSLYSYGLPYTDITNNVQYTCSAGGWTKSIGTNGTVNAGLMGQVAYYPANGVAVSGETAVPSTAGGTGTTSLTGLRYATASAPDIAASSSQVQTVIGAGVYDPSGAAATAQSNAETYAASQAATAQSNAETYAASQAATAQSNAETYASNASNLSSGTVNVARMPTAIPVANVGSAGLSGTSPIQIASSGAISCPTCNTSTAVINSGTTGQVAYYAANGTTLSGTAALANGTTATTQSPGDSSTNVATDAFATAVGANGCLGGNTIGNGCTGATTAAPALSELNGNPAAGTYATLCTGTACSPTPLTNALIGLQFLNNWHSALSTILQNGALNTVAAVWNMIGNSWMANGYIVQPMTGQLQQQYGNGGIGYTSFSNLSGNGVGWTFSGSWTISTADPYSLDGYSVGSSDTTDPATVTLTVCTPFRYAVLHYEAGSYSFAWQVDNLGWTTQSASGSGYRSLSISASAACHIIAFKMVSGSSIINGSTGGFKGVDFQNSGSPSYTQSGGVRVNVIGHSGWSASTYAALDPTHWEAGLTALNANQTSFEFAVNEQAANVPPATQIGYLTTLISEARTATPLTDISFDPPSESGVTTAAYTIGQYVAAQEQFAIANNYALYNAYQVMGPYATQNALAERSGTQHLNYLGGQVFSNVLVSDPLDPVTLYYPNFNVATFNNNSNGCNIYFSLQSTYTHCLGTTHSIASGLGNSVYFQVSNGNGNPASQFNFYGNGTSLLSGTVTADSGTTNPTGFCTTDQQNYPSCILGTYNNVVAAANCWLVQNWNLSVLVTVMKTCGDLSTTIYGGFNIGGNTVLPSTLTGYHGNSSGVKVPLALNWTNTAGAVLCDDGNGNLTITGCSVPTGANPSATATGTAINGSATTFMRSDAAPAIQTGSGSQKGLIASADWTTFNNKAATGACTAGQYTTTTTTSGVTCAQVQGSQIGGTVNASQVNSAAVPASAAALASNSSSQIIASPSTYGCLDGYDHQPCTVYKSAVINETSVVAPSTVYTTTVSGTYRVCGLLYQTSASSTAATLYQQVIPSLASTPSTYTTFIVGVASIGTLLSATPVAGGCDSFILTASSAIQVGDILLSGTLTGGAWSRNFAIELIAH